MYVRNGSERHWESILSKLNSKAKTFPGFLSVRYIAPSSYSDGKEKEEESSKKNTNKKISELSSSITIILQQIIMIS